MWEGWRAIAAVRVARGRAGAALAGALCLAVVLAACDSGGATSSSIPDGQGARLSVSAAQHTFDPSVGAPLPDYRIVAAYGIDGGSQVNGPASTLDMLNAFLPQLQQLGQQYAALDPIHPVKLGIDLVINSIQPCSAFPKWCSSFAFDADVQAYIAFCKQHNMLLFLDLQLGVEPVEDAIMNHVLPYLEDNSFVELALDTEFHFPNTPQGYADAAGYPCCLGWMNASEINWAIGELAQISLQHHLPRKVLIIHEWNSGVLPDKNNIQINPDVSVVLQSDGFGYVGNKLGDYQYFVQQQLIEYGGYKLFFTYPGGTSYDTPLQTPSDVMSIFPQPLFISYQ